MAAMAFQDREAPSVRPGQLEEMASMAMWVATAAMALEDRKAGREAPSVPTSVARCDRTSVPNLMLARGCVNPRPVANHAVTGIERSLVQCARLHWQMSSG